MRDGEFRDWLSRRTYNGRPLSPTAGNSRISWLRALERSLPDLGFGQGGLDQVHGAGLWPDLLQAISAVRSDWRSNEAAARCMAPEAGNPAKQIANIQAAARLYGHFASGDNPNYDAGSGTVDPDGSWPAIERMKEVFLSRITDFEDFSQDRGTYWEAERKYKNNLIAKCREIAASGLDDEAAGRELYSALLPPKGPPLRWQTRDAIWKGDRSLAVRFDAVIGRLARSDKAAVDAIMEAAGALEALRQEGLKVLTQGEILSIVFTIAAAIRPDHSAFFKISKASRLLKELGQKPLFGGPFIAREHVAAWLDLLHRIFAIMKDEWDWQPRDLLDVQGFAWVILGGWDEEAAADEGEEGGVSAVRMIGKDMTPPGPQNFILYGPPGTGKTYETRALAVRLCDGGAPGEEGDLQRRYEALREEGRIEFVTFHQSYSYEEFVEGLRPVPNGDGTGFHLEPRPGVFRRISERALDAYNVARSEGRRAPDYVLVIDEINRANISRVLGELITLLEPDKRLGQKNALHVTLPYSGELFGAPPNLHVVGTMNTADRSIALLDTALRRRFEFRELMPRPERLSSDLEGIDLAGVLQAINDRIEYLFDRDHQIGHAYFMDCRTRTDVDDVMRHKVIPLLVEYFHEDWEKVRAVLNEENDDGAFIGRTALKPPRLLADEDAGDEPRWRYQVRESFVEDAYQRLIG